jgi:hypothetical protein
MMRFVMILLAVLSMYAANAADIEAMFQDPPESARPWVYWFYMDGNLSREGMTADLEAMKAAGIGGVIIMEVDVGIPRGPVEFMSDEWCALFAHAVREAERLGLEMTLNAGPGWTGSGGPWVKADQSMQHLVASATEVDGPAAFDSVLPKPEPRAPYFGEGNLTPVMKAAREAFYVDEVVLAVPRTDPQIENVDEKALYLREPYTSKPGVPPYLPAPADHPELPANAVVPAAEVIDLSDRLQPDGRIEWEVPEGQWTILRFGRRTTGANTRPAPSPGIGFESDKFDKAALEDHFDRFVGRLLDAVGPRPADRKTGWTMLHIDSWEMGSQNWTDGFRDAFTQRRGYDPLPWLPAMTGRVVASAEQSERFLWDLRLTAQELVIENHAQHLKALGRAQGFGLSIEPYDMNPTTDMVLGGVADVPMCEFWSTGYGFDSVFSCVEAASVANTVGRDIVAAEAFTAGSGEAWQLYPGAMKNQGDWALATGINRIVFHRFAHQPWLDRRPGMTMGPYGVHWDRTQTWWPMADAYHGYLARCQHLLRQGRTVADVCYLLHEGAPQVFRAPASAFEGELQDRRGYNFDACTTQTLLAGATVEDGRVTLSSGAVYRLLVLPAFDTMTPALLRKINDLAEAGATIVGPPPRKSPSLSNYPACDAEVQTLAAALWGDAQSPQAVTTRAVGEGQVIWGGDLDVRAQAEASDSPIEQARWIWYPEGNAAASAPPERRYFRRVFTIDESRGIASAKVYVTADNGFHLFVNGEAAANGNNFHTVFEADVRALLKPGENVLAIRASNDDAKANPAGLIAALRVEYDDGSVADVVTDAQWQAARDGGEDWRTATATPEGWTAAQDLGASDMSPWNLDPKAGKFPETYPPYEATARILGEAGLPPDFEADGSVRYLHRRTPEGEFYFVANRTAEATGVLCTFRVQGLQPELWEPLTGAIRDLPEFTEADGRTTVPLRFEAHQSFFVVFRKPADPGEIASSLEDSLFAMTESAVNFPALEEVAQIEGPWKVTFDPNLGGPGEVQFDTLTDWSEHADPGIRHYSGIATYRKTFTLDMTTLSPPLKGVPASSTAGDVAPSGHETTAASTVTTEDAGRTSPTREDPASLGSFAGASAGTPPRLRRTSFKGGPLERCFLQIGEIRGMARVRLNGEEVGTLWCAPWQVDITDALQPGENLLEIDVANLWPNRLIGDKALPEEEQISWSTWNPYDRNSPLLESGLLGPVRILAETSFPLVDYHVHLKGGLTLDEAKAWAAAHGMRYGIAQNCGLNFPVTDDAGLRAYVADMRGRGVYVGMQAEGREWVELFSPEAIAEFDYVFTDAMTWRDDEGRRMRLWIEEEVVVGDPETFMDMLVDRTVWILENEPIDIYVNPTYLPAEIVDQYDALWTDERVGLVIDAAVRNGVAIEISAGMKLPKAKFIQRAKAAGAKFSFGTNNSGKALGDLAYCREMIEACGLTAEDMFHPKPAGEKAIDRKALPKRIY